MKERPILFSAPMVRAILDGSKTQTRRVVKPQPSPSSDTAFVGADGIWRFSHPTLRGPVSHEADDVRCPYGQPGDRLWVRETFSAMGDKTQHAHPIFYRADRPDDTGSWTPSIHMPRWASRILLEITGVRVDKLADLSKDDAMAEGIVIQPDGGFGLADSTHYNFSDSTDSFCSLWESINGAGSWFANPWVWVIEFKRVTQ